MEKTHGLWYLYNLQIKISMNFIKSINLKYTKKVTGASDGIG